MDVIISNNGNHITIDKVDFSKDAAIDMLADRYSGQIQINKLYEKYNLSTKPEKFKAIILHFSGLTYTPDTADFLIEQSIDQWKLIVRSVNSEDEKAHCSCSQKIHNLYYVYNPINKSILLIGSECINKFAKGTKLYEDFKIVKKIIQQCKNCDLQYPINRLIGGYCYQCQDYNTTKKKYCVTCLNLTVPGNKKRCKKCRDENNTKYITIINSQSTKQCCRCEKEFHIEEGEDFKTMCKSCYQTNIQKKICKSCKRTFNAQSSWVKECYSCYSKKI